MSYVSMEQERPHLLAVNAMAKSPDSWLTYNPVFVSHHLHHNLAERLENPKRTRELGLNLPAHTASLGRHFGLAQEYAFLNGNVIGCRLAGLDSVIGSWTRGQKGSHDEEGS